LEERVGSKRRCTRDKQMLRPEFFEVCKTRATENKSKL